MVSKNKFFSITNTTIKKRRKITVQMIRTLYKKNKKSFETFKIMANKIYLLSHIHALIDHN